MKTLYQYLLNYLRNDVKWKSFLVIAIYTGLLIFIEYRFNLTSDFSNKYDKSTVLFLITLVTYILAYIPALLIQSHFAGNITTLKSKKIWLFIFSILLIYAFRTYFYYHKEFFNDAGWFVYSTINQLTQAALVIIPLVILWLLFDKGSNFYTGIFRKFDYKPFLILIICVIPLTLFAATQNDFLRYYPTCKGFVSFDGSLAEPVKKIFIYESAYGVNFFATELFFRGVLIIGMMRLIGKDAILPMAVLYVVIHFGKPMGETISSFLGGIIMGVFAYETRSIAGCVVIHLGLAWLMEIMAGLGNWLK